MISTTKQRNGPSNFSMFYVSFCMEIFSVSQQRKCKQIRKFEKKSMRPKKKQRNTQEKIGRKRIMLVWWVVGPLNPLKIKVSKRFTRLSMSV